ncbi:WXG100 family type VII secretion target [Paenibacillus aurantiacus]|uniref:WXG100 family type VII secretion target n=1 Tax=Paenibacillus aurantiacus TaxID=1936118 RepID=A0ABV5KGT2_9BACL
MSASPSDIRRNAQAIDRLAAEVRQEADQIRSAFGQSERFWTGTAAKTFRAEQQSLNQELTALARKIEALAGGVERVASEVQRAEQERAEKKRAAERAAQEALKQKQQQQRR